MPPLRFPFAQQRFRPASIHRVPLIVAAALGTLASVGCGASKHSDSAAVADTSSGTDTGASNGSDSTGTTGSGGSGETTATSSSTGSGGSGDGGATSSDASTSSGGSGGASGGATSGDGSGGSGGSSGSGGSGGSGGDVPVCDSVPNGNLCEEDGVRCQIPGSPCGSIFTCSEGRWQEEVVCPDGSECPAEPPSDTEACALTNPAAGVQVCLYDDGCGQIQADCNGTSWTVQVTPASTVCSSLCEDLCTRLVDCGVSWAEDCTSLCSTAYACPGETVGQDAAICELRQTELSELGCSELCQAVTEGQNGGRFGEDCDGL